MSQTPPAISAPPPAAPTAVSCGAAPPSAAHSGLTINGFFRLHLAGVILPTAAGIILYGWRAAAVIALVAAGAFAALALWRRLGARGLPMRRSHVLWQVALLSLMLPPQLASDAPPYPHALPHLWAAALAAGILLVILTWLLGPAGSGPLHPVLITYLLIWVALAASLAPRWILQRNHLLTGDAANAAALSQVPLEGWLGMTPIPACDALSVEPASQRLVEWTAPRHASAPQPRSLDALVRDDMPPLEDLIAGGQPGPIGASCAAAVIMGGLLLIYRGVVDARPIPLIICLTALAAFLLLPLRTPGVTLPVAVTFAAYEMLAGPLLFMAFFLATNPGLRPMTRGPRCIFALLVGAAAAFFQLYLSVAIGPYVALTLVALLTPLWDRALFPSLSRPACGARPQR